MDGWMDGAEDINEYLFTFKLCIHIVVEIYFCEQRTRRLPDLQLVIKMGGFVN